MGRAGIRCERGEVLPDVVMFAPDRAWIEGTFPSSYASFLAGVKGAGFTGPVDCDDHTRAASLCAQLIKPGLAVGEYMYHHRSGKAHALNVAVVKGTGDRLELVFWEPQTMHVVAMTKDEVENGCIAWRF
jgi:hypothetical protein